MKLWNQRMVFLVHSLTLPMAHPRIFSAFFLIFLFPISALAQSNGTVPLGSTLTADESSSSWLSPSGDFAFGFKQLQEKDQFLLSIWYNKIPDKTVVWYPKNLTSPVGPVPRRSTVQLDARNGLLLRDPRGQALWRPDGIDRQPDHGFMNDTGNFVLKGSADSRLWETFRFLADTILPWQELEIGSALYSRQSETNFSNGRFYLRFGDDGNLVLSVPTNSDEDAVYYKSDTSDLTNPSNSGSRAVFDSRGSIYIIKRNNQTKQLSPVSVPPATENYYRATLEFDGVFVLYGHPKTTSGNPKWNIIWSVPDNICIKLIVDKGRGACGFNNICRLQEGRPACYCPKGYNLVDPNDKYGSCKPNFIPTCDEVEKGSAADQFDMLEEVDADWPMSDYERINPATEADCRQACLQDCFCVVAIFRSNSCWKKKLPLSNGRIDTNLNAKAFIKSSLSYAPPQYPSLSGGTKPKDRGTLILVGSVLLGSSLFVNFALIGTVCLGFYLIYRKKNVNFHSITTAMHTNLRCFTFKELTEATDGFKEELGSGSFGVVYKGKLATSSRNYRIAVKKLNILARETEFRAEVSSIGQTNHKNLVRLLGFCDEGQHRLLVYEFMSNGTLASFIFSDHKPSWTLRKQIAIGIAKGLEYLHEECSIQIIHCDIKPQNVLLDDYYNVRISDFGLAKLLDINQSRTSLTHVRGTRGYVAPEWFRNNQITAKVDVYSFGVLLLEIISCRKCAKENGFTSEDSEILTYLAWDCFLEGRLDTFIKDDLEALDDKMMLERFVMVGIWCVQENSSLRPTMRKVALMLEGILEVSIPPCPYPFSCTG